MDGNPAQQAFKELLPYLEALDKQTAAILQLLKDKGLTTDEQFAPYLEQAGNVSNVKWLAARLRIDHLLFSVDEDARKAETAGNQASARQPGPKGNSEKNEENRETEKTASMSKNQGEGKDSREAKDAKNTEPKQGAEKKDDDQEKSETTPAPKSAKPAENRSKEDSDKQLTKVTGSKAGENHDTERNTEKKAS